MSSTVVNLLMIAQSTYFILKPVTSDYGFEFLIYTIHTNIQRDRQTHFLPTYKLLSRAITKHNLVAADPLTHFSTKQL